MVFPSNSFCDLYCIIELLQYLIFFSYPLRLKQIPKYLRIQPQALIRRDPERPYLSLLHAFLVELKDLCKLVVVGLVGESKWAEVLVGGDQVEAVQGLEVQSLKGLGQAVGEVDRVGTVEACVAEVLLGQVQVLHELSD